MEPWSCGCSERCSSGKAQQATRRDGRHKNLVWPHVALLGSSPRHKFDGLRRCVGLEASEIRHCWIRHTVVLPVGLSVSVHHADGVMGLDHLPRRSEYLGMSSSFGRCGTDGLSPGFDANDPRLAARITCQSCGRPTWLWRWSTPVSGISAGLLFSVRGQNNLFMDEKVGKMQAGKCDDKWQRWRNI